MPILARTSFLGLISSWISPVCLAALGFSLLTSIFLAWLLGYYSTFFVYFIWVSVGVPGILLWDSLNLAGILTLAPRSRWDAGNLEAARAYTGGKNDKSNAILSQMKANWRVLSNPVKWRMRLALLWTLFMLFGPRYPSSSPLSRSAALDLTHKGLDIPLAPSVRQVYIPQLNNSANGSNKIYLAANLYNSAHLIPSWKTEMRKLAEVIGPQNMFLSIYESNSQDSTPYLLKGLEEEMRGLGVRTVVITSQDTSKEQEKRSPIGRPSFSPNSYARIAYMASLRNKAMAPLLDGDDIKREEWAKVVWINDVYWDWRSLLALVNTHRGSYDLVCGLDFDGVGMYDTWVMRDACGKPTKEVWPYIKSSPANAHAISKIRSNQPFEVASCWNGLAVFDAGWFLGEEPPNGAPSTTSSAPFPLRFRANTDCTESECYLSSLDLHYWSRPERPSIWVNPAVMTAYKPLQAFFHTRLESLTISIPWKILWQDLIGNVLFGSVVVDSLWEKEDRCGAEEGFVKGSWCEL